MTAEIRIRRTPPPEFGPALTAARRAAGLSGREAARRIGVGPGYLRNLEAGTRCPSVSVAESIAEALRLDAAARAVILAGAVSDAGRDHPRKLRRERNRALRVDP